MSTPESHSTRLGELDALRGVAALGVLMFHFTGHYGRLYGHTPSLPISFESGKYGVHLFFMISGFVIFMTLERTQHSLDFVVSRFSRLFPAYWGAMAVSLLAVELAGLVGQKVPTHDALVNLSMLADLFHAREVDGSYWTLQIELLFYAQMLFWYAIGGLGRIRLIICAWLVLAAAYGIAARMEAPLSYTLRELLIVRYIPFFAAGILLSRIHQGRDPLWQSVLLLLACTASSWLLWSWEIAFVLVVCAGIFTLLIARRLKVLTLRPLLFCGGISYTVYLVHQNIGFIEISYLEKAGVPPIVSVVAALATTILLAWILTRAVERPALRVIRSAYARWRIRAQLRATQEDV